MLRTALSAACREELIVRNVAELVEPPRPKARELSPWSLDETLDFLAAARRDPLYAAFVLAIATGLRSRVIPLSAMCLAPLRRHRMRQRTTYEAAGTEWTTGGYVFATRTGRPVEPRNVHRSFARVSEDAGLRPIRLHDARHGCATLLTAAGVAPRVVREILGHSQIGLTMDVCTHVVQDTQREAISHMDRLLTRKRPDRRR